MIGERQETKVDHIVPKEESTIGRSFREAGGNLKIRFWRKTIEQ